MHGPLPRAVVRMEKHRRETIIAAIVRILDCGRSSKFEYEAAAHHGLRSGLCLEGQQWAAADKSADEIVKEALHRIGATRPTWWQGQPEWTQFAFAPIDRFFCERCGSLIPEDRTSTGRNPVRFYSSLCSRAAKSTRHWRMRARMTAAERAAMVAATADARRDAHAEAMTKTCEHCGTAFRAVQSARRYCSHRCATQATREPQPTKRAPMIAERTCKSCGATFALKGRIVSIVPGGARATLSVRCSLHACQRSNARLAGPRFSRIGAASSSARRPAHRRPSASCGRRCVRRAGKYFVRRTWRRSTAVGPASLAPVAR